MADFNTAETTTMMITRYHTPEMSANQCGSMLLQLVHAPLSRVWSIVRAFHNPQAYKNFIKTCTIREGDGGVGTVRDLVVVSGIPATSSVERLDHLDDDNHTMSFSIIGGDHRLTNYRSTITLHEAENGETVVLESYVVDVPEDSSKEDTILFVNTIVKLNLKWLSETASQKS